MSQISFKVFFLAAFFSLSFAAFSPTSAVFAQEDEHDHAEDGAHEHTTSPLWKYSTILLAVLLVASFFTKWMTPQADAKVSS